MKRILLVLLFSLFLTPVFAADQWNKTMPSNSTSPSDIAYYQAINNNATERLVSYYRRGCGVNYATAATISVGLGEITLSDSTNVTRRFRSNPSNTTVTWTDIDTGSEATSTTYYVYGVADTDATTFTCMMSLSATAPTGATYYRRLGSFYNDGSGDITNIISDEIIGDGTISTLKLKTASGEVSTTSGTPVFLTLPGGEYGFYFQTKVSTTYGFLFYNDASSYFSNTDYVTQLLMHKAAGGTAYAKQRYVTASGTDNWIFLLMDKDSEEILSAYYAQ